MYFDGHELRDRFISDIKALAEKIRNDDSIKDKATATVHEICSYIDGAHDNSIAPMTLSFDPMDNDQIKQRMLRGEQIIVDPTSINTGEHLAGYFGGAK